MERGETVGDDREDEKRVVEGECDEDGVKGRREGSTEKGREGKWRHAEESQVRERVHGLIAVEYEMACKCSSEDGKDAVWETRRHEGRKGRTGETRKHLLGSEI